MNNEVKEVKQVGDISVSKMEFLYLHYVDFVHVLLDGDLSAVESAIERLYNSDIDWGTVGTTMVHVTEVLEILDIGWEEAWETLSKLRLPSEEVHDLQILFG